MSDFKCYLPQAYSLGRVKKIQTQTNVAYIIKRNVGRYSQIKSWGGGGGSTHHIPSPPANNWPESRIYLFEQMLPLSIEMLGISQGATGKIIFLRGKKVFT